MNGIVIGLDPIIVQFGVLALRWYGLFFALAVMAGVWLGVRESARKGVNPDQAQTMAMWAVVGGMIGARLFHVIDRWELYADAPLRALSVWEGGLAVYGGFVGGIIAGLAYVLWARLPVWKLLDAVGPGMILGAAVGRFACITNGDAYGAPANLPWAFIYTNPAAVLPPELLGVPLHPYPLYELLFDFAVLALLWRLRPVFKVDGLLFITATGLYALGRFLLTFYRIEKIWFWGLQEAQVVALAALVAMLLLLVWRLRTAGRIEPDALVAHLAVGQSSVRPAGSGRM